ncbi:MAG: branched-chain amino acid ABC transporter permease [Candidatus Geothermarchaeales archaeon]
MGLPTEFIFIVDLLALFATYMIVTLSLNLEFGYTGVPNFGKVLSVAGGAFVVGYFPGRFAAWLMGIGQGMDYIEQNVLIVTQVSQLFKDNPLIALTLFALTIILAGVVGAVIGFLASYPAIRLREDYLAMTLLAMGEFITIIGYNYSPIVGGTLGVQVPDPLAWVGEWRFTVATFIILAISIVVLIYVELLVRSPLGRVLRAVRDNEDAAESLGKDIVRLRMKTIVVSSVIASIGGALYAFYTGGVIATAYHRVGWTFWPWVMVMLGGIANNRGVALGTFTFVTVQKLIIFYKGELTPFLPFDVVWLDPLLLGLALIMLLMFRPEGIIPEKPTITLGTKRIKQVIEERRARST